MTESKQIDLSHVADWAAHNGWYRVFDAAVAELADHNLEYSGERSEFVNLISLISACDYDDSDSFAQLLESFAIIKKISKPDESEEGKWDDIKKDIVYQLVVSKLRQCLFLKDDETVDDANFEDPNIDIEQYRQSIIQAFDELKLYSENKKQRTYLVDVDSVSTVLFVKGHRKAFAKRKVQMFLEANETETFQRNTLDFIRDLLNDKFPTPVLIFSDGAEQTEHSHQASASSAAAASSSKNKRKHSIPAGQGENLTYAAVTSDDFMDSVNEKPTKGKKAKTSATAPAAPVPAHAPSPVPRTSTAAAASAPTVAPQSSSKALVHQFRHISQEFQQKYDRSDPLKNIIKAVFSTKKGSGTGVRDYFSSEDDDEEEEEEEQEVKGRRGKQAQNTAVAVAAATGAKKAQGMSAKTTKGSSRSSSDAVGVMNIEDDESEEDEETEKVPVARGSAKKAAPPPAAAAAAASSATATTPTASSTLNRLKSVIDEAQRKVFPSKLASPVAAPREPHVRRSSKPTEHSEPPAQGPQRTGWTEEETNAFLAGLKDHGFGNWKAILDDNKYGPALINRTNINLKDRFRTLEKKGLV